MAKKYRNWLEVETKVRTIISEQMGVVLKEVQLNTHFVNDLNADSLDTVELVMEMEDEFDISIPDELAEKMQTVGQGIQAYVRTFPRKALAAVDTKVLSFRLRPDGTIEVVLQIEDGSWTYADGTTLLPSKLYLRTLSKWASILKQLEDLVNDPKTKEKDLQKFFEEFPELIAGDDYDEVIPQATIKEDRQAPWKADFILAPINQTEFSKIVELKLPRLSLTKKPVRRHLSFSAKVWNAIFQLRDYGRAFDKSEVRENFKKKYGLDIYKPNLQLIAGRRWDLQWIDNIRELRKSVPVQIADWDSVLNKLKRRYK